MSGVGAQVLSHVVRRSVDQFPAMSGTNFDVSTTESYKLEISGWGIAGMVLVGIIMVLVIASFDYTVGSVISSLCMIESPSSTTTTILEAAPPPYSDDPDAPLINKAVPQVEDVEVLVVANKPITTSIRASVRHLKQVGGFFARWRGFFQSIIYHAATNISGHIIGGLFGLLVGEFAGQSIGYFLAVILTCRLHMLWTHSMIAKPSTIRWYKRFVPRKHAKAILLPTAVFAIARQLCIFVPVLIAKVSGLIDMAHRGPEKLEKMSGLEIATVYLRLLAVPVSMLVLVLFVYLPAATTLTRIEACLLPENQETIVPFDRDAIVGEIDLTQRGSSKQIFRSAWRSFNNAARMRLVKLYMKLAAFQFAVLIVGFHAIVGILFLSTSKEQLKEGINALGM